MPHRKQAPHFSKSHYCAPKAMALIFWVICGFLCCDISQAHRIMKTIQDSLGPAQGFQLKSPGMPSTWLVTGSGGFDGRAVPKATQGHPHFSCSCFLMGTSPAEALPKWTTCSGDIAQPLCNLLRLPLISVINENLEGGIASCGEGGKIQTHALT